MEEYPHLQSLYGKLKKSGLAIVSVNLMDDAKTITKYLKDNKFTVPNVMDKGQKSGAAAKFKVVAAPTNYLVDKNGKIIWSALGFDEAGMKAAIKKAGFKL